MRTIVIGLGNPILMDDGAGVLVARAVSEQLRKRRHTEIDVAEASVGGLRLMELMIGYERAVLIDALTPGNSSQPGRWHRLTIDDLRAASIIQHSASAHDTTLITALDLGYRMSLELPKIVTIFGIEVEKIDEFGIWPTDAVQRSIPIVAAAVLEELGVEEASYDIS